jgi:hypothetical protein
VGAVLPWLFLAVLIAVLMLSIGSGARLGRAMRDDNHDGAARISGRRLYVRLVVVWTILAALAVVLVVAAVSG